MSEGELWSRCTTARLTKLAESPAFALWKSEEDPYRDEERATCPEEASVAAPVPSGGVELIAKEDSGWNTELLVSDVACCLDVLTML